MKNIFILILCVLFTQNTIAQTVGKIKAETYQAEFEKKKSIRGNKHGNRVLGLDKQIRVRRGEVRD